MVFRLKHSRQQLLIGVLLLTVLFGFPYLSRDFLGLEHDTMFHLSRIEGLAESISRGDFFPAIYPYKNNGFGYASPLFYCDLLLIPSALLYLAHVPLSVCYTLLVLTVTFCSAWAMASLCFRITGKLPASLLSAAAFTFSNYRITDVYVRGALGEITAMIFLILLLNSVYELFEEQSPDGWKTLWLAVSGLICSHNLTALMGFFVFGLYWIRYAGRCSGAIHRSCVKALILSFLCTAWFTIPMLEQLHSQEFYLHYYAASSDLADSALPLWKYFANRTVFGYASNQLPKNLQMNLNPGFFLMISPLFWLFLSGSDRRNAFVNMTLLLGICTCLLPSQLLPWDRMEFLRILQFPWRFLTLAVVFLSVSASWIVARLTEKQSGIVLLLLTAVLAEGFWHVMPARNRTFGITSSTSYEDLLSGRLIDPYYSASYVRVELAGGEYLPAASPDFRTWNASFRDESGNELDLPYSRDGVRLVFSITDLPEDHTVVCPLTWYKGYRAYDDTGEVNVSASAQSLVTVKCDQSGSYTVLYEKTPVRKICGWISLFTCLCILFAEIRHYFPMFPR